MPRRARLELSSIPMHITQRGVNRCAVFFDPGDRRHYLRLLHRAARQHEIAVHAYALMDNHVHLLTSSEAVGSTSAAMRWLGQCYAQAFNRRYGRTGTLWEGRFKSCLVECENYLLAVYRYIDLNPVRAAMADSPEQYPWSSARGNLGLWRDPILTPHAVFQSLATHGDVRRRTYRDWLLQGISQQDLDAIRASLQQEKVLGSKRFRGMVKRTLNQDATWRPSGRPKTKRGRG